MSNAEKTVMFALPNMMTGQLACVAGTAAGRSWDLSAGTFTIGRLEEHDMSLPQEPGISKLHAKIIGQGDRYLITDCESRNGTLLNGELIQRADLYDGDEIRICGCVLRFTQKGGPVRPRPRAVEPPAPVPAVPAAPVALAQPPLMFEPVPSAMAVSEPSSSSSSSSPLRTLAAWYGAGLVGALLVGSIASATLLAMTPPPVPSPSAPAVAAVPAVPPAPVAPVAAAPVAPSPSAPVAVVDAGVVPVEQVAAAEAAAAVPDLADPPPAPPQARSGAPAASTGQTFTATPEGTPSETLRTRTGGRVRSVDVVDGATVSRGAVLVTFETGADADEIATLQDRIASLETVEGEEARRDLKSARARLAALEAGQAAQPIVAGISGRLSGFAVSVGSVLKPGDVVGTITDGDVPNRVRVVVRGVAAKTGQQATLTLKSGGTAVGTVASVNGRSVVVSTGSTPAADVASVSF